MTKHEQTQQGDIAAIALTEFYKNHEADLKDVESKSDGMADVSYDACEKPAANVPVPFAANGVKESSINLFRNLRDVLKSHSMSSEFFTELKAVISQDSDTLARLQKNHPRLLRYFQEQETSDEQALAHITLQLASFDKVLLQRSTADTQVLFAALKKQQHADDCSQRKRLACNLNKHCGFGCQIHHLLHCLNVAVGSGRTMAIVSDDWMYSRSKGWTTLFQGTCPASSNFYSLPRFPSQNEKEVRLDIVDFEQTALEIPRMPSDVVDKVTVWHAKPVVWWVGFLERWLIGRVVNNVREELWQQREEWGWSSENWSQQGPVVGYVYSDGRA
jgi:hypothetical protein